jgi:hypothetical protein
MTLLRPWLLAALCAALVAPFGFGWRMGAQNAEARHSAALAAAQARAFAAAEVASRKEAERLALEMERDALARDLEAAAYADPDRDRPALGADSVRRLNAR